MKPTEMAPEELAAVLKDMARLVSNADSFEGSIGYEPWNREGAGYLVQGTYRTGNRHGGQGGMRVIGDTTPEAETP